MTRKLLTSLLAAAALSAMATASQAAVIFISTTPFGTTPSISNPSISLKVGDTATLYYWCLPEATENGATTKIATLSTSMIANTSGIVHATAISPAVANNGLDPNENGWFDTRWSNNGGVNNGTGPGTLTAGGFFTDQTDTVGATGYGIRSSTTATYKNDSFRDTTSGAFLLGSVTFIADAVGSTDVFMAVGGGKVVSAGATAVSVQYGASDSHVSGGTTGLTGTVADATITVTPIPEPASLGLLAIGAMGLIARRKKA